MTPPRKSPQPPVSLSQGSLLSAIRQIWEEARTHVIRTVNTALVQANWLIGRQIVEAQQHGKERAGYGEDLLPTLARTLKAEYGSGFSVSGLKYMRAFFLAYPDLLPIQNAAPGDSTSPDMPTDVQIGHAVRGRLEAGTDWKPGKLHPSLSWIHYRALLKVE